MLELYALRGDFSKKDSTRTLTKMSVADDDVDDDDDILQDTRLYCEIINKSMGGQLVSRRRPLTLTK